MEVHLALSMALELRGSAAAAAQEMELTLRAVQEPMAAQVVQVQLLAPREEEAAVVESALALEGRRLHPPEERADPEAFMAAAAAAALGLNCFSALGAQVGLQPV